MGRRKTGGKRKPLYVECEKCGFRFQFWTDGRANETHVSLTGFKNQVPIKLVGKRLEWPMETKYRLSAWVHGGDCGGKLKRIDIPDPIRKVNSDRRTLECGHPYHVRHDMFGECPGTRRACSECGRALRIAAVKSGKFAWWEMGLKLQDLV